MTTTPDLGIPYIASQQAQPEVTHNTALNMLQVLLNGVLDRGVNDPPSDPDEGDAYIVGTAPTGDWEGRENCIAAFFGTAWEFLPGVDDDGQPIEMGERQEGLRVWVRDEDALYVWTQTGSPPDYAWVNFDPSAVASVNGKAGAVTLDAEDVGAVDKTGDTMTGPLALPENGLAVGTSQLAVAGGNVGIGTDNPQRALHVRGSSAGTLSILALDNDNDSAQGAVLSMRSKRTGDSATDFQEFGGWCVNFDDHEAVTSSMDFFIKIAGANSFSLGLTNTGTIKIRAFTVATLPSASPAGQIAFVSDGASNKGLVVSDGTNWRFPDGAIAST